MEVNQKLPWINCTLVSSPSAAAAAASCGCAKGQVVQLTASALQKTKTNNARKNCSYVLDVRRSDSSEYRICRTYCNFVCLNNSLPPVKDLVINKKLKKKEIPKLPDKIERTKDLPKLNKYLESLVSLQEDNESLSKALRQFCRQEASCDACCIEDFISVTSSPNKAPLKKTGSESLELKEISSPLALPCGRVTSNYKPEDKRQLCLQQNTVVKIFKKCPTGWWYVICGNKSGWFPASYLELLDTADIEDTRPLETPEAYKAGCDFEARNEDELSFATNDTLNVRQKNMDGWWLAEHNGRQGFVPATYLRACEMKSDSNCYDMCRETLNMNPTMRWPNLQASTKKTSADHHLKKGKGETSGTRGIDHMPAEEITRDEEREPRRVSGTPSLSSNSSSRSSSICSGISSQSEPKEGCSCSSGKIERPAEDAKLKTQF